MTTELKLSLISKRKLLKRTLNFLTWQWKMYSGVGFLYFKFQTSATPSGSCGASSLLLYEATSSSGYWTEQRTSHKKVWGSPSIGKITKHTFLNNWMVFSGNIWYRLTWGDQSRQVTTRFFVQRSSSKRLFRTSLAPACKSLQRRKKKIMSK